MTNKSGLFKRASGLVVAVLVSFGITAGAGALMDRVEVQGLKQFSNTSLEGSFSATSAQLGSWTIHPSACLDGRERGIKGIVFAFESGPVKEIRIDTARKKNNVVSVHLDDDKGSVVQMRQGECDTIAGETHASNVVLNGAPMKRLRGSVTLSCSRSGLEGHAAFDGCLPDTVEDLRSRMQDTTRAP